MRRMLLLVVLALALPGTLLGPHTASAQTPPQDSVTGTLPDDTVHPVIWTINASSGPSGENPTGTLEGEFFGRLPFPVTCLQVTGNRAVIGGRATQPSANIDVRVYLIVVDEPGEVQDRISREFFVDDPLAPATCAEYDAQTGRIPFPVPFGSVVVIDAQPVPTSRDQCKNGGWRNHGSTFKNEGQCVSFVATGGKKQP